MKRRFQSSAQILHAEGVAVISLFSDEELAAWRTRITRALLQSVELFDQGENISLDQLAAGSFGAFNHPTSYHCAEVRELRGEIRSRLKPFIIEFSALVELSRVEVLPDRLRFQPKGSKVGAEKEYHRDASTGAQVSDVILGGWLNLSANGVSQYFSYLTGTQLAENPKTGFTVATKPPSAEQLRKKTCAAVPSGSIIFFYQNILHNVHSATLAHDSFRLHYGLRFTDSTQSLFNLDKVFKNFEPPRLPSGQPSRMYPKLWWTNWRPKLVAYSARFRPDLLVQRATKKEPTVFYSVVPEILVLPEGKEGSFAPYPEEEKLLYTPQPVGNTNKINKKKV